MIIAVAGKYSAESETERQKNLDYMNDAAARLLEHGHIPLIGVNAALPVIRRAQVPDEYEAIMAISLAVVSGCEAILVISNSQGADRERDLLMAAGKPVFYSIDDVPITLPA